MSRNTRITRKRFCKLMMAQGAPARRVKGFTKFCIEFDRHIARKVKEMNDPEVRERAEAMFGRLCWKDAWEELKE